MDSIPSPVTLRAYQREAIDSARAAFQAGQRSTLVVLPTGAGKTVIFAEIARLSALRGGRGAVLVLAHRRELIDQARAKIQRAAPDARVDVEQGRHRADRAADVVVASVPTLSRGKRLGTWPRDAFSLIVVDEAHHALAASYRRILDHFGRARVLGFTATPDRGDGGSLAEVFQSVAYSRSMLDLIRDGHLVPLRARTVHVDAFDLEGVQLVGGDFDGAGIAAALGEPGVIEALADLLVEHHEGRATLVFVAGVDRAHELAEALEARDAGGAVAVDGTTPDEERAAAFDAFQAGAVRFLVNVGVATEGTDLPRCACVAVARPTMSRPLLVQMVGRGLRLFDGKADCLVLNFAPSNARHRLALPTDALLPPEADDQTRELAAELAAAGDSLEDAVRGALEDAPAREQARILAEYEATLATWDPFEIVLPGLDLRIAADLDRTGYVEPDWQERLRKKGVPAAQVAAMTPGLGAAALRAIDDRQRAGLCTLKQARKLRQHGLNPNVTFADAQRAMAALNATGWRYVPRDLLDDPTFRLETSDAA